MISSLAQVEKIISSFSKVRVAVFGDLMLDIHIKGKAERISQEAPVPVVAVKEHQTSLGGAANVVKNLAVFESKTFVFGVVGKDKYGYELSSLLNNLNCDTGGLVFSEKRITTRKERVIAGTQQLLRIDYEDTNPVADEELKNAFSKFLKMIEKNEFDAVIVEDYAKGLVNAERLGMIVNSCKKSGVICALDPHPSHPLDIKGISYMTPNRSEAYALAGINFWSEEDKEKKLYEVAAKLIKNWRPEELIITLGADGMALFKGKSSNPCLIPTKAKEVFDVSGAGDTVIALYTLAKTAKVRSEIAAEIANHAAGIVVGKIGAATASAKEIIESFKSEGLS